MLLPSSFRFDQELADLGGHTDTRQLMSTYRTVMNAVDGRRMRRQLSRLLSSIGGLHGSTSLGSAESEPLRRSTSLR